MYLYIWMCLQRHLDCWIVTAEEDNLPSLIAHNFFLNPERQLCNQKKVIVIRQRSMDVCYHNPLDLIDERDKHHEEMTTCYRVLPEYLKTNQTKNPKKQHPKKIPNQWIVALIQKKKKKALVEYLIEVAYWVAYVWSS